MSTEEARPVRLEDYRPPDWLVETVELDVSLYSTATQVRAALTLRPNGSGAAPAPLVLDGDALNLCAAAAIFFLMFVGVAQIVGRTVFDFAIYGYIDWMEQASALFAFLGIAYAQRLGSHIGMDLTMGWRPSIRWKIELFGVVVAIAIITVLVYASFTNFLRAWSIGDSTMDIQLPTWPAKLMVPLAFSVLWLRLSLQICGYLRSKIQHVPH